MFDYDIDPRIIIIFIFAIILTIISTLAAYGDRVMTPEKLLVKQLKMEEGLRTSQYLDTTHHQTIGYGHNINGRPLSIEEQKSIFPGRTYPLNNAELSELWRTVDLTDDQSIYLLEQDIHIAEADCAKIFKDWNEIPSEKKVPLIDMSFNLGAFKLRKFKRMIAAVEKRDWKKAGKEVRNSLSYVQARSRYERIAKELEK